MNQHCIYLRKSRADEEAELRGEGETLARHERALLEYAHRLGTPISHIYREVVSGETIAARPQVQRLLADLGAGKWAGVFVMDVDRLARGDTIDQGIIAQSFKYSGAKIYTPLKVYDPSNEFDEEFFEFGLFMSRREYKMINRRMQAGRMRSLSEGKYVGNKVPYGYKRVKLAHEKGFVLEPDAVQAPIVRMIYEWFTTGDQQDGNVKRLGVNMIVTKLNNLGIAPPVKAYWSASTVRPMLRNPVYIGKLRWNCRPDQKRVEDGTVKTSRPRQDKSKWLVVQGRHPAIVDEAVFERAQQILDAGARPPIKRGATMKNPLSGLVMCAQCGHNMARRPYKDYPAVLYCTRSYCNNVSNDLAAVEDRLLDALRAWLHEYRLRWDTTLEQRHIAALDAKRLARASAEQELATARRQTDSLYNLLEQGVYTSDVFLSRSNILQARIAKIQDSIQTLTAEIAYDEQQAATRNLIAPRIEHLLAVYKDLPAAQDRNELLKEVLEKVVYNKPKGGRWSGATNKFSLELYPRIPKD